MDAAFSVANERARKLVEIWAIWQLMYAFVSLTSQAMPLKSDDPMQFYTDMRKLGQGASGTVFVGTDVRTGEVRFVAARKVAK